MDKKKFSTKNSKSIKSLYIHIPFCEQKCGYCDFLSFSTDKEFRKLYMETLFLELEHLGKTQNKPLLETIFIGGGTPSLLTEKQIDALGLQLNRWFDIKKIEEFSIEVNPETIDSEKAMAWKHIGVNRISMGIQSSNDNTLKDLGRIHTWHKARNSYLLLRQAGFQNINVDVMFGLPHQNFADWQKTIDDILSLEPDHVSAYGLTVEQGTPFEKLYEKGLLNLPQEEEERKMYHHLVKRLNQEGVFQYELSNFARKNRACRHNLVYWSGQEYYAVGMGAHSYVSGVRQANHTDFSLYKKAIDEGLFPVKNTEVLSEKDKAFEAIMLGLRLNEGVFFHAFEKRFGYRIEDKWASEIKSFIDTGALQKSKTALTLTDYGRDIANTVMAAFLD